MRVLDKQVKRIAESTDVSVERRASAEEVRRVTDSIAAPEPDENLDEIDANELGDDHR